MHCSTMPLMYCRTAAVPPPYRRALYRKLGAKLVVGMPFKDLATSDSVLMYQVPWESDAGI